MSDELRDLIAKIPDDSDRIRAYRLLNEEIDRAVAYERAAVSLEAERFSVSPEMSRFAPTQRKVMRVILAQFAQWVKEGKHRK